MASTTIQNKSKVTEIANKKIKNEKYRERFNSKRGSSEGRSPFARGLGVEEKTPNQHTMVALRSRKER
jgi:hypothetical protein